MIVRLHDTEMLLNNKRNGKFVENTKYRSIKKCYQIESVRVCGFGCLSSLGIVMRGSPSVILTCEILEAELPLEYGGKESFHSNVDMLIICCC